MLQRLQQPIVSSLRAFLDPETGLDGKSDGGQSVAPGLCFVTLQSMLSQRLAVVY